MERSADLIHEAERERRIMAAENRRTSRLAPSRDWRMRWRLARRLLPPTSGGRAAARLA
jgi:hypothetical protein